MKMATRVTASLLAVLTLAGCGGNDTDTKEERALSFPADKYTSETMTVDGEEVKYRAFEQIVYVENPVDEQYQAMNIYIPEAYFNDESIGDFTADTAPIFFPNNVGGYLPAEPGSPSLEGEIGGDASRAGLTSETDGASENRSTPNAALMALSKGYIVASPGARGRTTETKDGKYTGKAPAAIVDLKAAVRYLHYNNDAMPGDAGKIISNGTSAGGALSVLLGATGNNSDYDSYLEELGAADAKDDIYAVSSYCPITNLDHADTAYEWMFNTIHNYATMKITNVNGEINRERVEGSLTAEQIEYSNLLKDEFVDYLNNLSLNAEGNPLTLGAEGEGSFKEYVKRYIIGSAQTALDQGGNLSEYAWITIADGKVTDVDFEKYIEHISRSKSAPAYDAIDLSAAENNLFGTKDVDSQHFTEFSADRDAGGGGMADEQIITMMNPMYYIGNEDTTNAKYWRIRHGSEDSDTALAVPVILATTLDAAGYDVDFAVPWGQGHGGDYDLEALFSWMDRIIK